MKIAAFIDSFINPAHFRNFNTLRHARLLVRACFLTSMFSTSYVLLSHIFGFEKGVYLMVFNVLGFLLLPLLVKTRIPIAWLGNLFILIGAFAIIVLTYYSGGVWSAVYPWIISIPVLALLVVNRLSGIIWGSISFAAMICYAWLAYQGVELPIEYNAEFKTEWFITVLPGLLLIILFIAFVFEFTQSKTLKSLEVKNELLESQKETIAQQSTDLEKLIEEKDVIIRILAHDLRNPLKNITTLTRLMASEQDVSRQSEYIVMINQSTTSAHDLVNRVLEMDASDQNNISVDIEKMDIGELIAEVVESMDEYADRKEINIHLTNHSSKSVVLADKTYLTLIFENLISNAIKFSDNNTSVHAVITDSESAVQVKIMDEGPGISPEEEDRLFKKFSKLSNKPTGGETSTGLGLSLVKRYVDLIGGKVWYERHKDKGAVFVVELPLAD